ncbi:MAG: UDP-N-acetylglucosamine--N-acetylmuramyl-(pentapeptide) pyrophosphoryl-undecaprenol N-acetylglucosamine transferase [Phycisphaerales bacterium]|nr:MAG: UDP-N-acetylglucosamine--N-acetylmuramyl-(pentapeptide) pyrophosphoryl-undecaprenol N-acetylglucosamine transferase [Phycisphaerales bacterium]
MTKRSFFFAGGGTGGHIYPAVAVAEKLIELEPRADIRFFCSPRPIDRKILDQAGIEYTALPAAGFFLAPRKLVKFCASLLRSYRIAKQIIAASDDPVVVGVGGFVAAPVCLAAQKLSVPIALLNVDVLPGRANKLIARWANQIFVQFQDTKEYLAKKHKGLVNVVGCPLRTGFDNPQPDKAIRQLGLDRAKKTLLITGASSGSVSINTTVCSLVDKLDAFAGDWQIVHLTGLANCDQVKRRYGGAKISHNVLGYFDDMSDLLTAVDLVIGRSGAVSVAEYAAAGVPSICMPYPHHKDRQQYLNAGKLVQAGAAVIVDDLPDAKDRADWLWEELEALMKDQEKLTKMEDACRTIAPKQASSAIAQALLRITRRAD